MKRLSLVTACLATLSACAGEDAATLGAGPPQSGTRGVLQSGAQDIAEFRSLVAGGQVPAPEVIDATGFFAEHALDLPPARCGHAVCANPLLAVAPRFDNTNWTMAFVSLSTAVDPTTRPRADTHLVVVLEQRAATAVQAREVGDTLAAALSGLRERDRVSLIAMAEHAQVVAEAVRPQDAAALVPRGLGATPAVGLYEGLATASALIADTRDFVGQTRVLLITSGQATAGITAPAQIVATGEALVRRGVAFSVVGVGRDYLNALPRALGEMGAGTYAYAQNISDLRDILTAEFETSLAPLATGYRLEVRPAPGYTVGRIYGARRAKVEGGAAVLEVPALFVGSRMGSRDVAGGRRGGGGGLFVELVADPAMGRARGRNAPAFTVLSSYLESDTGERVRDTGEVLNPLAAGEVPETMWPVFSDMSRAKVFVMLNMYLALRGVTQFYEVGDCARATGLVNMMTRANDTWLRRFPDPDLQGDDVLLQRLGDNVSQRCRAVRPVEPLTFSGGCFGI